MLRVGLTGSNDLAPGLCSTSTFVRPETLPHASHRSCQFGTCCRFTSGAHCGGLTSIDFPPPFHTCSRDSNLNGRTTTCWFVVSLFAFAPL